MMPPEFWNTTALYIGTNRALAIQSLAGVRFGALVMRDRVNRLWDDGKKHAAYHELWKKYPCWKVGPADTRTTHCNEYVRQVPGWQYELNKDRDNRETAVMRNNCVVIMACNMAWHWGVRDFHLIGVDYYGDNPVMADGFERVPGTKGQYDVPVPTGIEIQFNRMREGIESGGGAIVNHSPNTKLKAIECIEFTLGKAGHTL